MTDSTDRLPLSGIRVVDLADPVGEAAGRLLADLGADVLKLEPPAGAPTMAHPLIDGELPAESVAAPYGGLDAAAFDHPPAPEPGEHTRAVCTEVLGLDDAAVDELMATGVVFDRAAEGGDR